VSPGIILRLSLGLVVLYGLVVIVWYELLRSIIVDRLRRGRGSEVDAVVASEDERREGAQSGQNGRVPTERMAPEELDLERTRKHYHLARKAAKAERDAAIEAASDAAGEAIERIDRRYREIDGAFIEEETERISELLRRPPGDRAA
jgi:hypothetical protein